MKKLIIGLTGQKHSGKDTAARALCANMGFEQMAFATPLKNMLLALGLTEEQLYDPVLKEKVVEHIGKSPRYMMQTLGDEWGRELVSKTLWVDIARQRIATSNARRIVFSDVRKEEERALIEDLGGEIIHIRRGELKQPEHRSEQPLEIKFGEIVITNNKSVASFCEKVCKCGLSLTSGGGHA